MNVVVSGATGFLGRALLLQLAGRGHHLTAWVRDVARAGGQLGPDVACVAAADPDGLARAVAAADAVVHLAGAPIVGKRWTARRKRELIDSRVTTADALVAAIQRRPRPLPVLITASAVGYYGDRGDELLPETAPRGDGFAAELCERWEQASLAAAGAVERVVCARIGIVLGRHGGALPPLVRLARLGLGGAIAGGAQWVPWIHLDDAVGAIAHALVTPAIDGALNVVGPTPVHQRELAAAIGAAARRRVQLPAPRLALRALLGEAASVVLGSQHAVPAVLERTGYQFAFPTLTTALADLIGAPRGLAIRRVDRAELPPAAYLERRPPRYALTARTVIDRPLAEVAAFFAAAENLPLLTPPSLAFALASTSPIAMAAGTTIDYRIAVARVALTWRTVIERWDPGRLFVDAQHRGPYASWWHEHRFERDGARTIMDDVVYYAPPLGVLGRIANWLFVAPMLRDIFGYRGQAVRLRFGTAARRGVSHRDLPAPTATRLEANLR